MVTLSRLFKFDDNMEVAESVMDWIVKNLQDRREYFNYQLNQGISSKISYMRWSKAFMFFSMSYYLLEKNKD